MCTHVCVYIYIYIYVYMSTALVDARLRLHPAGSVWVLGYLMVRKIICCYRIFCHVLVVIVFFST